ncbi:(S)-2-haloacid dehalogenase [Lachnellula suecica]|uniref:(S)-2-haloacid dehalogenase n=1 Tax=Lachnellula suecica TaxID=602035 RepID=A0A8T9C2Y4_9HELO|nr:(S)-2-haloacid dehalogenase [Lachnellula suecica]
MTSSNKTVIAFDLYGTLLSTESIAKELATHFGDEKAQSIAALWRRFQLEYTWRMNSMGLYKSFSDVTNTSLRHALDESGVSLSDSDISNLMKAYDSLGTFPDVPPALKALASDSSIDAYIFSNGTDAMVSSSVKNSDSLSPHASVFKGLITVEEIKAYKPDPKVYQHLAGKVGKKGDMGDIWLVSGNPFDVVGARAAGMQAAWVSRAGGHHGQGGWTDKLGELANGGPTVIVNGVEEAVNEIKKWSADKKQGGKSGAGFNSESAALGPG